ATPALAAEDTVVLRVKTADLDLQTQAGAQKALSRITRAAQNVCTIPDSRTRTRQIDERCFEDMTRRAVADLKAPVVLALYEAKTRAEREG
ncbi:MAG TPA: UrcA family protein, partial [Caulobacteraceae bacterium]|nr:UrcA family protein [Caulobacteraceae bacterium]